MNWVQLGGSIAAVLVLAGVAWALRLGQSRIGDADEARRHAEQILSGFEAGPALVSEDGGAAIVAGNGAVALLKRHGAQVAARRLPAPLALAETSEGVTVKTGERLFGDVTLRGVAEAQVRGLEASLTRV